MPALAPSRQRSPIEMTWRAAAGERAHDRGTAADVGAVTDDDPGRDAPLDHRGAQRAGVEVDEALVHHRGAAGQVRAQPHPVGVGDAHPGRHDVVGHPRELVDPVHRDRPVPGQQPQPGRLEPVDGARPDAGPHHVGSTPKMPSRLSPCGRDQPVREQVQAQVGVDRVGRCGVEVDHHVHHVLAHAAARVAPWPRGQVGRCAVRALRLGRRPARGSGTRCRAPCRPR